MKVGFIGNTNNYPFTLALALHEIGVDVRFVIDSTIPLHRPEYKYKDDLVHHGDWVVDLAPLRTWDVVLPTPKRRMALAALDECDAIVANGIGIGLSTLLNKPTFIISTGSDLDSLADPQFLNAMKSERLSSLARQFRNGLKIQLYRSLISKQRLGFERAIGVEYALPTMLPHGDELLKEIGVCETKRHCFLLTDVKRLQFNSLPVNEQLTILLVARLNWVAPLPPGFSTLDNKRTDIFLKGVAEFRRQSDIPIKVKLVRKGLHITETMELVDRLSLSDCVIWSGEMTQAELTAAMLEADVIADQFGEGSIGVSVRDALALGRPVIANGKSEVFERYIGEALPIAQARTPDEVANAIQKLVDPSNRQVLARKGREFAERHFSAENAASVIMSIFRRVIQK